MTDSELINKVDQYIEQAISLEELESWFVPRLPILFSSPFSDSAINKLATEIEVGLAELSEKVQTENEFRDLLKKQIQLVPIVEANYPSGSGIIYTSANNQASPNIIAQYTSPELVPTH